MTEPRVPHLRTRHPLAPGPVALVAAGGAIGALARYGVTRALPGAPGSFPATTFAVNVGGAFLLAVLLEVLVRKGAPEHWLRLFAGVGVLGAFTTFSTFATETALLWRGGRHTTAVLYATSSAVAGVVAVFAGLAVAGWRRTPVPAEDES
ncbi:MAG: hypothetical protein AMXMBFR46_25920 [Acidimicrobiia bacterium]